MTAVIRFTPGRAREWLLSQAHPDSGESVAVDLGIWASTDSVDILDVAEEIVLAAPPAVLSGPTVLLWITRDRDGLVDGALITVDLPGVRIATQGLGPDQLTTDLHATGVDAAVGLLTAVAVVAGELVASHRRVADEAVADAYRSRADLLDALAADLDRTTPSLVSGLRRAADELREAATELEPQGGESR